MYLYSTEFRAQLAYKALGRAEQEPGRLVTESSLRSYFIEYMDMQLCCWCCGTTGHPVIYKTPYKLTVCLYRTLWACDRCLNPYLARYVAVYRAGLFHWMVLRRVASKYLLPKDVVRCVWAYLAPWAELRSLVPGR
jgi:hypothetical protein